MPNPLEIVKVGAELAEELAPVVGPALRSAADLTREVLSGTTNAASRADLVGAAAKSPLPAITNGPGGELAELFGHNPIAQAKLAELPPYFHASAQKLVQEQPNGFALLESQLSSDTPRHLLLNTERLEMLSSLATKVDSEVLDGVLRLERADKRLVETVFDTLNRPGGQALVARMVKEGAPIGEFDGPRLDAASSLENLLGAGSPGMNHLLALEKDSGLDLTHAADLAERLAPHTTDLEPAILAISKQVKVDALSRLIDESPGRAQTVVSELRPGVDAGRLNSRQWLPGLHLVSHHLSAEPSVLARAVDLGQQNKLNLFHLGNYIDGNPTARLPAVRRLLEAGKAEHASDLMRLSMFPQATAERIADASAAGSAPLARIVQHSRDMEFGQSFVDLTTRRVQEGQKLTSSLVDQIALDARNNPLPLSAFVDRQVDERTLARSFTSGSQAKLTMPAFAARMNEVTSTILERFDPDRTLVVLGRDMNPFAATLRAHGRNTIGFHFSRMQVADAETAARWKLEVPPHSVVIDSGLRGTIHDEIESFDETVEPYLLVSNGKYPQLIKSDHLQDFTDDLEKFPKITGRCSGYSPLGSAICRSKDADESDLFKPSLRASEWNQSLMQEMGLSDWYVWRYRNFTGVSQSERLGISSPDRIDQYLQTVQDLRSNSGF